jgi:hypothetical protein
MASRLKRLGQTIGRYDPTNPANVGRVAPIAAGAATGAATLLAPEMSAPLEVGISAAAGAATPYTEWLASKAVGGKPAAPSWRDAARGAILNSLFTGAAQSSKLVGTGAREVAPEMAQLPEELRTPAAIKAAVRNREFLRRLGMNDEQISEALKNPADIAEALRRSVDQGQRVADTFKNTVADERARFNEHYADAYGEQANALVDPKAIGQQILNIAEGQGQHELTPTYRNFLLRKGNQLLGDEPRVVPSPGQVVGKGPQYRGMDISEPGMKAQILAQQKGVTDTAELAKIRDEARAAAKAREGQPPEFNVPDARELRTELRENVPATPTNLDRKAAHDLNALVTQHYEDALRGAGASEEQLGRLNGIDADYKRFQQTIQKLRPGSKEFGEQTADAFFQTAKQNPTLALNFVRMAQDAGTLPEFRESFLKQITQELRAASRGPLTQEEILRKLQTEWRGTEDGKAVLEGVFGKDSPMASPVEFSKVMGSANNPEARKNAIATISRYVRSPEFIVRLAGFYATYSLFLGHPGSPWSDYRRDPAGSLEALAETTLTMAGISKVMSHLAPPMQKTFVNWVTNRDPDAFARLIDSSGKVATALTSQPKSSATARKPAP